MRYKYIYVEKVDSNNNKQKEDNSLFNRVVSDAYKIIKYKKKREWLYLPKKEHLDSLLEKLNNEIELEIKYEDSYIMVRKK